MFIYIYICLNFQYWIRMQNLNVFFTETKINLTQQNFFFESCFYE